MEPTAQESDNLLIQLHHLLDMHRNELGEQQMDHELEWLAEWVTHILSRHFPAPELDARATALLQAICESLQRAISEEKRLASESPLHSQLAAQHELAMSETRKEVGALLRRFSA